jgi:quinol monooxygenase YgiN
MTVTSVHVLRYDDARGWPEQRAARPAGARYWHPGVFAPLDSTGVPVPDESEWTVVATWADAAAWRGACAGPGPWDGTRESWSCLLSAGETRVNPDAAAWADGGTVPPFGSPSLEDPSGPVAIITTVAHAPAPEPAMRFARDVEAVVDTLPETSGCLGYRLGGAEDFPATIDAFTFSLWASWADARTWAYRAGVHADAMRDHMSGDHVSRATFTAFAVVETLGSCEVIDAELERLLALPTDRRFRLNQALPT